MRRATKGWRRSVVPILAAGLLLTACGGDEGSEDDDGNEGADGGTAAHAEAAGLDPDFDWRRFEGTELFVMAAQHPWPDTLAPMVGEFEELTGIDLTFEQLPTPEMRQRILVEMVGGSDNIDVFMSSDQNDAALFHQSGWYHPLNEYIESDELVADGYDFDDFGDGLIETVTIDGDIVSVPVLVEFAMLYYRGDVFEEAGVEFPPEDLEAYEEALAAVDDPDGRRALAARGESAQAVTQFSGILYNFGGDYLDEEGNAVLDSPEAIEAFEYYGRIIREYGLSGSVNNSAEESMSAMQSDQAVVMHDASAFLTNLSDPEISLYGDEMRYTAIPPGPEGEYQTNFGWGLSLSSMSQNKDAGWYFIQWATSPGIVQRVMDGGVIGGRESTEFPDDMPEDFVEAIQAGLTENARSQLPPVTAVPEARDIIGQVIVTAIQGGDVASAAASANGQLQELIDSGFDPEELIED